MTEVASLTAKRWERDTSPNSFTPRDALVEMLRQLDAGEIEAEHLIVFHAWRPADENPRIAVGYFQAGEFDLMQTMGMVTRGLHILNQDEM